MCCNIYRTDVQKKNAYSHVNKWFDLYRFRSGNVYKSVYKIKLGNIEDILLLGYLQ